ncbi:MAG: TauD/TfdA family dioxygenase [Phenylobacterium sp.]|uniref:TauD/TfdA family dioxygenase n=1 Tax=Phenylobacterium sp. TaxID=1871053 RepID=UPI0025E78634|nr:TauD/TfdA family dioxygenase [Phenylobacterium sp.]MCA3708464.1 TauD/TfdA family dioxygenase [Phenylobacterium sp.]
MDWSIDTDGGGVDAIRKTPVSGSLCWTGASFDIEACTTILEPAQADALHALYADGPDRGVDPGAEALSRHLAAWIVDLCERRSGFARLRALGVAERGETWAKAILAGLCAQMGDVVSQNRAGDRIVEVSDYLKGGMGGGNVRGYATNAALQLHSDSSDITGLLCTSVALEGGRARIASAHTIYNTLLAHHLEYMALYHVGVFYDSRGEERDGAPPAYRNPIFHHGPGGLSCRYFLSDYIEPGYRKLGLSLDPHERAALDAFEAAANADANVVTFDFEAGDIVFYGNNNILHGRTAFLDAPADVEAKRVLHRVWLNPRPARRLPANFAHYRWGYQAPP